MTEKNKSIRNFPNSGNEPKLRFSEFTEEWKVKKLGEIGEIVNGLTYNPDNIDDSGILVLRSSNVQNRIVTLKDNVFVKTEKFNPVKENDILICVRNGSKNLIGKNAIIKKDYEGLAFGAFMTVFRSPYNKFVFQWFDTKQYKEIVNKNLGATINSINGSDLKKFKVPFPSYEEQQKISSLLSLIDDRIEWSMKIITHIESLMKELREKIFSQQFRFKDDLGNNFPKWQSEKLGNIGTFFSGGTPLTSNKSYYKGNIPFIKSGEINSSTTTQFISQEALKKSSSKMVNKGDLIYALYGATSGEVGLSKIDGAINQAILCVRTTLNNLFLLNYLKLKKENILKTYLQGGQGNLSADIVKSLTIPIPSLQEQTKIADFLSSIEEKIEIEKKTLTQYETQKKYLLANLFV
ncbi:Type-1 restriction enzyme EcoKI specificity protein [compost metagenome]